MRRERRQVPVPLTVIESPYREITRPIIEFVQSLRRSSPRDVVTVFNRRTREVTGLLATGPAPRRCGFPSRD